MPARRRSAASAAPGSAIRARTRPAGRRRAARRGRARVRCRRAGRAPRLVSPRNVHEHERERLVVLPRGRGEPAELVVQVGLVVDAGERIAPGRLTGRRDQEQPATDEQQRSDGEDEHDRACGRLAARALDDEDEQDHEQRAGHADRGPDPQGRAALGPVRLPPDPERRGDRREADQAGLDLPAEVDQPARDVAVAEDEMRVDAVGDPAGRDTRGDEPAGERAAPRRDERRRRDRAEQDEVEHRIAEPHQRGAVGAEVSSRSTSHHQSSASARRQAARPGAPDRRSAAATAGRTRRARRGRRRRSRSSRLRPPRERHDLVPELGDAPEHLPGEPGRARDRDEHPEAAQALRNAGRSPGGEEHGGGDRHEVRRVGEDESARSPAGASRSQPV